MVTINGIPVYNALVNEDDLGMLCISLVDSPAVLSDFQSFADQKPMVMFSVANEEKRIVRGCLMRNEFPIYRRDQRGEYYIIYKADTIREMAEKYLRESRQNNVNLMHVEGSNVEGVNMVQYFIKDSANGISPTGFEEISDGSLFAEYHVTNDDVWNAVKDGTFKGFSLEGYFALEPEKDAERTAQIADELEGKFKKHNMSTLTKRIKDAIAKAVIECSSVTTDKGVLFWETGDELAVGDEIFVENEEGVRIYAQAGDAKTEDGTIIRIEDGKVAEIIIPEDMSAAEPEPASEPAPVAEPEQETAPEAENEPAPQVEEPAPEPTPEPEPVDDALKNENESLKAEKDALQKRIEELEGKVAELESRPAAQSAHEEVITPSKSVVSTGVKGLDRLAKILNA